MMMRVVITSSVPSIRDLIESESWSGNLYRTQNALSIPTVQIQVNGSWLSRKQIHSPRVEISVVDSLWHPTQKPRRSIHVSYTGGILELIDYDWNGNQRRITSVLASNDKYGWELRSESRCTECGLMLGSNIRLEEPYENSQSLRYLFNLLVQKGKGFHSRNIRLRQTNLIKSKFTR